MPKQDRTYFSYLLRAWREQENSEWRFSLEEVFSEKRIHFSSLGKLFQYLADMVQEADHRKGENPENEETPKDTENNI